MLNKILALIGIGVASCGSAKNIPDFTPYSQPETNQIYNMIFCDDLQVFKPKQGTKPTAWQTVLFSNPPDLKTVLQLAEDTSSEGRIRYIACNLLKQKGHDLPAKKILGVIVEISMNEGLDVLAAFSDGGVRYINYSGKMAIAEGGLPETKPIVNKLFEASQTVVSIIGVWGKQRLPPPQKGNIRLSFLVSDGLYFGEGSADSMQTNPMSNPVLSAATTLIKYLMRTTI